jgi:hypothetical protein
VKKTNEPKSFERAIIEARAKMSLLEAEIAETAETELQQLQRIMTECAMELIKNPDEAPDPTMLLQRIRKMKQDCRQMYVTLERIHAEAAANPYRAMKPETWQHLCKILNKM